MVFEKKSKEIFYVRYTEDRKIISRKINLKRALAEETNKIVTVFNNESEAVKLNQSILTNIGLNCFLKHLNNFTEKEQMKYLQSKAIEESNK